MAVFMVVMVLLVVSAIGIFSARVASQVDLAVGQARHSLQAQNAAEFAIRALVADIAVSPDIYLETLSGELGERGNCLFHQTGSCMRKESGDILINVVNPSMPDGLLGALSHDSVPGGGVTGTFTIELDDLASTTGASAGYGSVTNYEVTVLSVGQVLPAGAPPGSCSDAFTATGSLQKIRGQVTFGPFTEGM
jgi:hypothetical protein